MKETEDGVCDGGERWGGEERKETVAFLQPPVKGVFLSVPWRSTPDRSD